MRENDYISYGCVVYHIPCCGVNYIKYVYTSNDARTHICWLVPGPDVTHDVTPSRSIDVWLL